MIIRRTPEIGQFYFTADFHNENNQLKFENDVNLPIHLIRRQNERNRLLFEQKLQSPFLAKRNAVLLFRIKHWKITVRCWWGAACSHWLTRPSPWIRSTFSQPAKTKCDMYSDLAQLKYGIPYTSSPTLMNDLLIFFASFSLFRNSMVKSGGNSKNQWKIAF